MTRATLATVSLCFFLTACGSSLRSVPRDPLAGKTGEEVFARGLAYEQSGDLVRAEEYIAAGVRLGFPYERAIGPLLRVCVASSRYGAALAHARDYLQQHPDQWRMRYIASTLYAAVGRHNDARQELERIIAERPKQPEPQFALARLHAHAGENAAAKRGFRAYLHLAPAGKYAARARAALALLARAAKKGGRR